MFGNKFSKAKRKWYREVLKSAVIYYEFGLLTPHVVCQLETSMFDFKYWKFNDYLKTNSHWKYRLIYSYFQELGDKFFNARKLSFKNPKIYVMYETSKSNKRNYIKMLKQEGLL